MRSNIGITLFDESAKRSWLNKATINTNIAYARIKSKDIEANSTWGSPLRLGTVDVAHTHPYLEKVGAEKRLSSSLPFRTGNPTCPCTARTAAS